MVRARVVNVSNQEAPAVSQRLVKDVMQHNMLTCQPTTSLDTVARRLTDYGVHALVVTDDGYAVGIVSQTDLLVAHYRAGAMPARPLTAGDIMSSSVIACTPETTIFNAVMTMTRNHIHRLVVVKSQTAQLYPLGIVSMTDIIRHLLKDTSAQADAPLAEQRDFSRE
jgi:signal-transduction protein with cAMP-binding, CBS, and nucleotidyltransferase domain